MINSWLLNQEEYERVREQYLHGIPDRSLGYGTPSGRRASNEAGSSGHASGHASDHVREPRLDWQKIDASRSEAPRPQTDDRHTDVRRAPSVVRRRKSDNVPETRKTTVPETKEAIVRFSPSTGHVPSPSSSSSSSPSPSPKRDSEKEPLTRPSGTIIPLAQAQQRDMLYGILLQKLRFNFLPFYGEKSGWSPGELVILNSWKNAGIDTEDRAKAVKRLTECKKNDKKSLSLNKLSLKGLPTIVFDLNLSELDISGNELRQLPPKISNLKNLTKLNVSNNQLTSLPLGLSLLSKLKTLNLSNNKLTDNFPISLGKLSKLKKLYLDHNELSDVPLFVMQLSRELSVLSMSHNQINTTLDGLNRMERLRHLNVSDNQMNRASAVWTVLLRKLVTLDLSNNSIIDLPFSEMPESMKVLNLSGNPISDLPRSFGPFFWSGKEHLRTTAKVYGNMRIGIKDTNLIAGLHSEGRLELKDRNESYVLPEHLRKAAPSGNSHDGDNISELDLEEGAVTLPPGAIDLGNMKQRRSSSSSDGTEVSSGSTEMSSVAKNRIYRWMNQS